MIVIKFKYIPIVFYFVIALSLTGCSNPSIFSSKTETTVDSISTAPDDQGDQPVNNDKKSTKAPVKNVKSTKPQHTTSTKKPQPSPSKAPETAKSHIGEFVGEIDSNSIEIKVTDASKKDQSTVFRLDGKIKESFESYNLDTGDKVTFKYVMNEHNQPVITSIEKAKK